MTTPIAQGPVDVNVRGLLDRLQARADNAYCDYIGLCRRDECLGWEAKVEKGIFGGALRREEITVATKPKKKCRTCGGFCGKRPGEKCRHGANAAKQQADELWAAVTGREADK